MNKCETTSGVRRETSAIQCCIKYWLERQEEINKVFLRENSGILDCVFFTYTLQQLKPLMSYKTEWRFVIILKRNKSLVVHQRQWNFCFTLFIVHMFELCCIFMRRTAVKNMRTSCNFIDKLWLVRMLHEWDNLIHKVFMKFYSQQI